MTTQLAPTPVFRASDNNGNPLVGGQLFAYAAGTATPQNTYTDSTGLTPNTNPVILNARGEANVWLTPSLTYKLVLEDSQGNQIWAVDNIPGGFSLTQQIIGQLLYPQTAAEISAGVMPSNYAYPSGNILRYNADPLGIASSWLAVTNAAAVCKLTGLQMIVPPGDYLIDTVNGTITLEFVSIVGVGATNLYSPDAQGSVLNITGTTNSPFAIRRGVSFNGVDFFYPNQNTDGTSPVVYPPTIIDDNTDNAINNVYISKCKVFNAYRFFVSTTGAIGILWITDNSIYGISTCIELQYNPDFVFIRDNTFSFDIFNTAQLETNPSYRFTTRTTGQAILVHQTDGLSIRGNGFYGYQYGINFATTTAGGNGGLAQQCQIVGNIFDATQFAIAASGPGNFTLNSISGGNQLSGWNSHDHTQVGNGLSITTSGNVAIEINTISGNTFTISTGDELLISGNTPGRQNTIASNTFFSWGAFQSTGTYNGMNISGNNTSATLSGNTFRAAGGGGANLTGITASAAGFTVNGNLFSSCFQALNISATNTCVTGNESVGTTGTFANNYSFPSPTNTIDIGNKWDKDSQASSGWGAPTGAAITTNFPGATATLLQTTEAFAALQAQLLRKGIISA